VPFTFVNHRRRSEKDTKLKVSSQYEFAISTFIIQIHELSAALWVHIAVFETTLRQFISQVLSLISKRLDWWNSEELFLNHESRQLGRYKSNLNFSTPSNLQRDFSTLPSLSFWINLLSRRYGDRIWRHLENQNPTLKSYGRRNFQQKAVIIKDLRNAIAHHAPILHRNLERDLAYIQELSSLISPSLADALNKNSNALTLIDQQKINQMAQEL